MNAPAQTFWFLHGAVGLPSQWDPVIASLKGPGNGYRKVNLWDDLANEAVPFEDWARAFNQEVAAAPRGRNFLVGYSLGGRLALHALLDQGCAWDGAVLLGAHPGLRDDDERLHRMADDATWAALALTAPWEEFLQKWDLQSVLSGSGSGGAGEDPRLSLEEQRQAVARSFMAWSLGKQRDLRADLGTISCPLLWLTGERDPKFCQLAQEAAPLLPSGRHHTIANAGHRLLAEAPEEVADAIERFIKTAVS